MFENLGYFKNQSTIHHVTLSPKTRRDVGRVIPFGVLWFIFSLIYCTLEKGILGDLDHYPSTGNQYKFAANIFSIPALGLMMGLLTGILEIGYFSKWFIKKSFTIKIVFKSLLYLISVVFFLVVILLMNAINTHSEHSFENLISPAWAFFTGFDAVGLILSIASIIVITQFYAEFSQSIGPGTLSIFTWGNIIIRWKKKEYLCFWI